MRLSAIVFIGSLALLAPSFPASSQAPSLLPTNDELNAYPSYLELVEELLLLQSSHPNIMTLHQIGESHGEDGDVANSDDNRDIFAVKISDLSNYEDDRSTTEEPDVLFIGGQHAREWISVAVSLNLIRYLVENYNSDFKVRDFVDNAEIWIIPLANPDGYEFSRTADRLWRKNRRANENGSFGVDLNRNFPYPLGYRWNDPLPLDSFTSVEPNSEMYRGESAFSEPESRAIRDLVDSKDFRTALSFHSFGQAILYPWGIESEIPSEGSILRGMAETMSQLIKAVSGTEYRPTQSYNPLDTSGGAYLKHGEISDWLYSEGIFAFTLELRPKAYGFGGFILPIDQIQATFDEVLPAALYTIETAIGQELLTERILPTQTRNLLEAIDINRNRHLDEVELFVLIDHWISGVVVSGTGLSISDSDFFGIIDKWIGNQPLYTTHVQSTRPELMRRTSIRQRQSHFMLEVEGADIASVNLQIFDLSGHRLLQKKQQGSRLSFWLVDADSMDRGLANGVYLYTVTAYGRDGRIERSQVEKFVFLR